MTSVCGKTCMENESGQRAASFRAKGDTRKQEETTHPQAAQQAAGSRQYLSGVQGKPWLMCQHTGTTLLNACYAQPRERDNDLLLYIETSASGRKGQKPLHFFFFFWLGLFLKLLTL